jgi:hypothetical protein
VKYGTDCNIKEDRRGIGQADCIIVIRDFTSDPAKHDLYPTVSDCRKFSRVAGLGNELVCPDVNLIMRNYIITGKGRCFSLFETMLQHEALDNPVPKRVLIRLRERHEQYTKIIISQFLELQEVKRQEDCYSRICAWNDKFYIALDICCKSCPTIALEDIDHEVYRIQGTKEKL